MYGTLPAAIGNLTYLQVLSLPHNKLHGSIPDSPWASMPNLTTLDLGRNRLHGSIPSSLGQLSRLSMLNLGVNRLNGTIPEPLLSATALTDLYLDTNRLTGTIPTNIGQLSKLEHLLLVGNLLHGTLPNSIGQLSSLTVLAIGRNKLNGTLPGSIELLLNLTTFSVRGCAFTGTIPTPLCALQQLQALAVDQNDFTGTLPACVGSLSNLVELTVNTNRLDGTIPPSLDSLVNMHSFDISVNYLTGTIPDGICAITPLVNLIAEFNLLTGSIPNCMAYLTELREFVVQENMLDGTIPVGMWQLPNMVTFWINFNHFTGPIADFSAQPQLTELLASSNYLTGTLPDSFAYAPSLLAAYFDENLFSGTIPVSLGTLADAAVILVGLNILTGTIPSMSGLRSILQLDLNANHLSGSLDGVFDASTQVAMLNVFLNDNQLTGTLPDELFMLPKLNAIVAHGNCFTGTLSVAMCESPAMVSLILDGLHTSPACRRELLADTHSYTTGRDVHGTIPACLFAMPYLATLHLAGNGLTGTLPAVETIAVGLTELTVSHNYLTGTIPAIVQAHCWGSLDLSYNRLTGTLQSYLGSNCTALSLFVQNNRLSGRIPSSLVHLQTVSVLGSNMFACKIDKSDLPKHDGDRDNYQCGSDAFNGPFYVSIALTVVILMILALIAYPQASSAPILANARRLLKLWNPSSDQLPPSVRAVLLASDILCRIAVWCTALIIVVLVPWYAAASNGYSTYTYEYAWAVSAAFLSGVTPLIIELVLYCTILVVLAIGMQYLLSSAPHLDGAAGTAQPLAESRSAAARPLSAWQRTALYATFLVVNLAVVVGVNAGFVAVALTQSNAVLVFAQIMMSLFKLLWSTVGTPKMISMVTHYLSSSEKQAGAGLVMVQVFIGLFNNIAIPCLVVAVLSPSCFYGVFDAAPISSSSFRIDACQVFPHLVICSERFTSTFTSTFSPPFRYDYQCSSSFITYYAPAFVYLGLAAALAVPSFNLAKLWLYQSPALIGSWLRRHLGRSIPPLLNREMWSSGALDAPLFDVRTHFITLVTYLGILLTFGVVFPPLAVVMCATMLSVAWRTKLSIGRFLHFAREQSAPQLTEAIDRDCRGAASLVLLHKSIFLIMCFACFFYALFLFDTLGDAVGLSRAYWVLIVMPLFPAVLYTAHRLWQYHSAGSALPARELGHNDPRSLEVTTLPASGQSESAVHSEEIEGGATYNAVQESPESV